MVFALTFPLSSLVLILDPCSFFQYAELMLRSGPSDRLIQILDIEGVKIQGKLYKWHQDANTQAHRGYGWDSGFQKALVYGHASLIFLANTFDYYPFWNLSLAPRMSRVQVDHHVDNILKQTDYILNGSGGSAVFLLYPLRIAGTRATSEAQRGRILNTLDLVLKSGFVVSDRIKQDLLEYWRYKDGLGLAGQVTEI